MKSWIVLFRGINVGGNHILPMAKLKSDLEALGLKNVRTVIQSGNVVFDAAAKSASSIRSRIAGQIEEQHGFRPQLIVLTSEELLAAVDANPFSKVVLDPKTLHFFFLAEPAKSANIKLLDEAKSPTENYRLTDHVFYLHAPDGIGRSKLAASAEKHLGVAATARNYRTVNKLVSMVLTA